jgi:AbrB family looped-hinge helix DNA binding protein
MKKPLATSTAGIHTQGMKFTSKLGERGQVVIPKPMRDSLGLNKNSAIEFELKGTTITLKPSREQKMRNFELAFERYGGSLRKEFSADGYTSVNQYLDEIGGFDETRRK